MQQHFEFLPYVGSGLQILLALGLMVLISSRATGARRSLGIAGFALNSVATAISMTFHLLLRPKDAFVVTSLVSFAVTVLDVIGYVLMILALVARPKAVAA